MKQLNFRYFNTDSKKFFETVNFFQKEAKKAPKRPVLFYDTSGLFQKISEGYRRFPKTNEEVRP